MKGNLSADDAAEIVSRSGWNLRARLRELRDSGALDTNGAWQDPPQKWNLDHQTKFPSKAGARTNWPFNDQQG